MKVTFCTYDSPSYLGGPATWLSRLLPDLQSRGVQVTTLFFLDGLDKSRCRTYQHLLRQGISCHAFPMQSSTEEKIHWLLTLLEQSPPDIFVPHMLVAGFFASRWVKAAGIPTVGVLHSDDEFYRGVLRQFVFGPQAYQLSALVCVSDFLRQKVETEQATTITQVYKIPCGVPLPEQLSQPPTDTFKLIYVGRLTEEQKRISEVTRAFCQAVQNIPGTEATIYGDGSDRVNVEAILQQAGQGLPIHLAGQVDSDQLKAILQETHGIVLLSDYEGLPVALMEAMAYGVVPICLNIRSGIPELIEDGVQGLLVNDRREDFIAAVRKLKDNPDLWLQLSQSAHHKIAAAYSQESGTTAWLELFEALKLQGNPSPVISHPKWLHLPAIDPGLAWEDRRRVAIIRKRLHHRLGAMKQKVFAKRQNFPAKSL
jgi:colanic acid/amylovoran biosynthesis glycosyltransferase